MTAMLPLLVVDTIRFTQERMFNLTGLGNPIIAGVYRRDWRRNDLRPGKFVVIHRQSKLRAVFLDNALLFVEVSLPRTLYGCNSRVITSQKALEAALSAVETLLMQICLPATKPPIFTRVDLVWQFKGNPRLYFAAFRHARHPWVRRDIQTWGDSRLCFPGDYCRITFYDKGLQMNCKKSNVVRVEVGLAKDKLRELVNGGKRVRRLKFSVLYEAFRRALLKLHPQPVPRVSSYAELIAEAERNGVDIFTSWKVGKSDRQIRRVARDVAQLQPRYLALEWKKLLPRAHPPVPPQLYKS